MAALAPGVMSADEAALWSALRIDRDDAARQHLFERHAGFARSIARRQFNGRSQGDLEFQDVHQWACTGLLEAIDRFDPTRGVAFRTYAAHRISGSISNGISTMSEVREQQSARARVRRDRLRSLAPGDVVGLSDADALQSLAAIAMGLAVGFMLEGTRLYVEDEEETIVSRDQANGYDSAAWYELTERLLVEIESLPSRERMILQQHYLQGVGFDVLTDLMGLSKGRISQLHRGALDTLRKRLARQGHFSLER